MDIKRLEALEKLADLKRRDVLTDAEFQSAKKKILAEQVIAVGDRKEPQTNIVMKSNEEPTTGASLTNEPSISEDQIKELKILESLLTSRSITQEEFAELKKKILDTELPQSSSPTSAAEEELIVKEIGAFEWSINRNLDDTFDLLLGAFNKVPDLKSRRFEYDRAEYAIMVSGRVLADNMHSTQIQLQPTAQFNSCRIVFGVDGGVGVFVIKTAQRMAYKAIRDPLASHFNLKT